MDNNKFKKVIILLLVVAILIMSSAYALLYRNLSINGNASVVASWKVEIVGIKEGTKTGNALSLNIPTYTVSTATFNAQLQNIGDSIEYVVTIKNGGRIDAKLNSITAAEDGNNSIVYEILGVNKDDILKAGESVDVTIKVSIDDAADINETINNSITIVFGYVQNV